MPDSEGISITLAIAAAALPAAASPAACASHIPSACFPAALSLSVRYATKMDGGTPLCLVDEHRDRLRRFAPRSGPGLSCRHDGPVASYRDHDDHRRLAIFCPASI